MSVVVVGSGAVKSLLSRGASCVPLEDRRLVGHTAERQSVGVTGRSRHWGSSNFRNNGLLSLLMHAVDGRPAGHLAKRLSEARVGIDRDGDGRELGALGVTALVALEDGGVAERHGMYLICCFS